MSASEQEHGQTKSRQHLQTTLAIVTRMGRDYRLGAKPRARAEGNAELNIWIVMIDQNSAKLFAATAQKAQIFL